jgi:hypothetical protein
MRLTNPGLWLALLVGLAFWLVAIKVILVILDYTRG